MTWGPSAREVKRLVARTFIELGMPATAVFRLKETVLFDGDRPWSHTYRVEGARAVWTVGEGIVEFRDAEGRLLLTLNLLERIVPQRMAA